MQLPTRIDGPLAIVGDVHGQLDLFDRLLERLRRRSDWRRRWIVLIGDLVDRGPDSRGVIERVLELVATHGRTTAVCGNHDLAMAATLGVVPVPIEADWERRWLGGYECEATFASYGATPGDVEELRRCVPESHARLLADLPWLIEHPRVLCVHAGLVGSLPLETQLRVLRERDFSLHHPTWLCSKGLENDQGPHECRLPIASGHVPVPRVHCSPGRYLVDTTGGRGGELSCLLLPEQQVVTSHHEARRLKRRWWQRFRNNAA